MTRKEHAKPVREWIELILYPGLFIWFVVVVCVVIRGVAAGHISFSLPGLLWGTVLAFSIVPAIGFFFWGAMRVIAFFFPSLKGRPTKHRERP